jgi:hypothetical protein
MIWPYEIDTWNEQAWTAKNPIVENLKKRDDVLIEHIRLMNHGIEDLKKNHSIMAEEVANMRLFNLVYQFYFEDVISREETRRLIMMLNSPDEQDKNLARELILKLIK